MLEEPSKSYMKGRPPKTIFSIEKQTMVQNQIKKWLRNNLPPNTEFYRKRIFGSLAKGTFGKYTSEYKERLYSDVDVLFVVDDNFKAPKKWKVQFEYIKNVWIVYDRDIIPIKMENEKIPLLIQFIVIKKSFAAKFVALEDAEKWGIPLKRNTTKNKYISF